MSTIREVVVWDTDQTVYATITWFTDGGEHGHGAWLMRKPGTNGEWFDSLTAAFPAAVHP